MLPQARPFLRPQVIRFCEWVTKSVRFGLSETPAATAEKVEGLRTTTARACASIRKSEAVLTPALAWAAAELMRFNVLD